MQLHNPLSKLTPPKLGCGTPLGVRNRSLFVCAMTAMQRRVCQSSVQGEDSGPSPSAQEDNEFVSTDFSGLWTF